MRDAVIVAALRTPAGKGRPGGPLYGGHLVDLLAETRKALPQQAGVAAERIDDVIVGCVSQSGERAVNRARNAVQTANWPVSVPAVMVDCQGGSSQQAQGCAAQAIMAASCDAVVAAGVASMSHVPMKTLSVGAAAFGPPAQDRCRSGLLPQGIGEELIAARWGFGRIQVDLWSVYSHLRVAQATSDRLLVDALVAIAVDRGEGPTGEWITSEQWRKRFPEIDGNIHAGISSPLSDGAAALMVIEAQFSDRLATTPLAQGCAMSVVGDNPVLMLAGVISATRAVTARAGMQMADVDVFEAIEAFVFVVFAWLRDFDADPGEVNVHGAAIDNSHRLGGSGAKLTATLLSVLHHTRGRRGLPSICEGGGMANATSLERLK